jgi:hypothetical protein
MANLKKGDSFIHFRAKLGFFLPNTPDPMLQKADLAVSSRTVYLRVCQDIYSNLHHYIGIKAKIIDSRIIHAP